MQGTRFFILDRAHPPSLTLRDYSKVVAGYKTSLSKKKSNSPKMSGGSMPSLRARWSAVCLAVAICFVTPTLLSAQGTNGRILGHVVDPSGAVLPGVKVTL